MSPRGASTGTGSVAFASAYAFATVRPCAMLRVDSVRREGEKLQGLRETNTRRSRTVIHEQMTHSHAGMEYRQHPRGPFHQASVENYRNATTTGAKRGSLQRVQRAELEYLVYVFHLGRVALRTSILAILLRAPSCSVGFAISRGRNRSFPCRAASFATAALSTIC